MEQFEERVHGFQHLAVNNLRKNLRLRDVLQVSEYASDV